MTERNGRADPNAGTLDAIANLRLAELQAAADRRLREASLEHAAADPPPTQPSPATRASRPGPCPECTPVSHPT